MLLKTLISLLPLLARVADAIPLHQMKKKANVCFDTDSLGSGSGITTIIKQVITTDIVPFPVLINTLVPSNTVLNFNGGVKITINNAPTQIRTVATGSSTTTNTAVTTIAPAPSGGNINIFQTTSIFNFPVVISTFIQHNTIFQTTGGVNIVINNAPTFISTTAIGTSTVTATVTSTVTETENPLPTAFLLSPFAVAAAAPARKIRRQTNQRFIGANGTTVGNCTGGGVFSINNGQLSIGGNLVSTNNGTLAMSFKASQAIGDISTTFAISDRLTWLNDAFDGAAARFCAVESGIQAIFTNKSTAGCVPQDLFVIPAELCSNGQIVSSSSTSSTASSTTGSSSSFSTKSSSSSPSSSIGATSTTDLSPTDLFPTATSTTDPSSSGSSSSSSSSSTVATSTTDLSLTGLLPTATSTTDSSLTDLFPTATSTTDPSTTGPSPTDPSVTDPFPTNPSSTDPSTTDPSTTDPSTTDPSTTDPSPTDPSSTDPSSTDPSPTDPSPTDPSSTDPSPTDPSSTAPSTTDPSPTDPSTSSTVTPLPKVCDAGLFQVLDALTGSCVCDTGFTGTTNGGDGLVCTLDVLCNTLGEVLDKASDTCVCLEGYTDTTAGTSVLTCVANVVTEVVCDIAGQLLDPITNICVDS